MSNDHAAADRATVESIRKNELLSTEALQPILMRALESLKSEGSHKFILDGFPRKFDQALAFEALVRLNMPQIDLSLLFF